MKSEIDAALEAHAAWRKHFRDYLSGRASFDAASAGASDLCQFGRWLSREGYRLMPSTLFGEISVAHDEFHRVAGDIVAKIRDKQFVAAGKVMAPDGAFNLASERLSGLLRKATLCGTAQVGEAANGAGAAADPAA